MTSVGFRRALSELDLTQSDFARLLQHLGDDRPWPTILRTVQELSRVDRPQRVPWAVAAVIRLLHRLDGWRAWE